MSEFASGFWTTEAPLTPEQMAEDRPLLTAIAIPDGVVLKDVSVYVNGREWTWERMAVRWRDIQRSDWRDIERSESA